jgi:glycosyltransferase involved in cell wall biosynthesis
VSYVREYVLALWRLRVICRRILAKGGADVVISCNPPDFMIALARPFCRRGAGVIFDHHDLSPELFERRFGRRGLPYWLLCRIERWTYRQADVVIETNESYARVARGRGRVDPDRVFVVRQGPDAERIHRVEPAPELRRGRKHLVLWIGKMTQPQRLAGLLDAADELVNRRGRRDITFAAVGTGPALPHLRSALKRRGLADFFVVPGMLQGEPLRQYLSTADVCVSVDPRNPMNNQSTVTKVLDYMAMGQAIVQWPLDEMRRVCGDTTVYARPGDAVDLANHLAALLDDPERRERLGAAARQRALDGLMWTAQEPHLLAAVEAALRARDPRPGVAVDRRTGRGQVGRSVGQRWGARAGR